MIRTPDRLAWLDLARGLAVVSMIVAHTSPWGGVLNLSEYLSAPWFAFLLGSSLFLASRRVNGPRARFVWGYLFRGLLLMLVGWWLASVYQQIVVVLPTLGLVTIVLAPAARRLERPRVAAAAWGVLTLLSPLLQDASRRWLADRDVWWPLVQFADLALAGHSYRLTSSLAFACAGMVAAAVLADRRVVGVRGFVESAGLGFAAASVYWVGKRTVWGADAYSGSTPEIVGATLLSLSATWFCVWLVATLGGRGRAWLAPLIATGRMALTAYAVQFLGLATIVTIWLPGQRDDHWWVMLSVLVLCLGTSWLWLGRFRQGPLEALLRAPQRALGG